MKDDLQKSDSCGLKSERKKILTSSTCSLACLSTNLGAFCPMVVHLPSEKSILPYFSGPRGVAILDCDSHSQAGSSMIIKNFGGENLCRHVDMWSIMKLLIIVFLVIFFIKLQVGKGALLVFKQTLCTCTTFLNGARNVSKDFFHANSSSDV